MLTKKFYSFDKEINLSSTYFKTKLVFLHHFSILTQS